MSKARTGLYEQPRVSAAAQWRHARRGPAGQLLCAERNAEPTGGCAGPGRVFRLNRSELVHLRAVERLEPYFNDTLVLHLKGLATTLTSSTHRTPALRRWLLGS